MNASTTAPRKKPAKARRKPARGRKAGVSAAAASRGQASGSGTRGRGIFITLEGGEGTGKSTQMRLLAEKLRKAGHEVVATREPGGSPGAEAVRHVLLSGAAESLGADMEAILFAASRADHVDTVIAPALALGQVVISDRFFDSTRVYQAASGKADPQLVRQLEEIACGTTLPDLTVIIDLDPAEGMRRAEARRGGGDQPDRFEKEALELHERRREAYLEIARQEPKRCAVIDGSGTAEKVFGRLWKVVTERLPELAGRKRGSGR